MNSTTKYFTEMPDEEALKKAVFLLSLEKELVWRSEIVAEEVGKVDDFMKKGVLSRIEKDKELAVYAHKLAANEIQRITPKNIRNFEAVALWNSPAIRDLWDECDNFMLGEGHE